MKEPIEQANYVGGNNQFENTFNQGWRNHPNFSWRDNQNSFSLQEANTPLQQEKKADIEAMIVQMAKHTNQFIASTRLILQNQEAQIKNLEVQSGQIATANNARKQGTLPISTEVNPRSNAML